MQPEIGIILGTGLGRLADSIDDPSSADTLNLMASKYDEQVLRLGRTS